MQQPHDYESLIRICETRKSTRVFDSRPVPPDLIDMIRKAALTSPYASGRKNWEIRIVSDRSLLNKMAEAVEEKTREISLKIRPDMREHFGDYVRNFTFFRSAPVVFVPVFRSQPSLSLMIADPDREILQWERDNFVKSISCPAMLMLLAAESLGLGGCYVTGALIAEEQIAELMNLPTGRSIGALVPVGYKEGKEL